MAPKEAKIWRQIIEIDVNYCKCGEKNGLKKRSFKKTEKRKKKHLTVPR